MAKLVDLKITAKERKAQREKYKNMGPAMDDGDIYPYESRISFNDDMLEKIGLDSLPKVGKTVKVIAECVITSTSENASTRGGEDKKQRRMELQIQKIGLDIQPGTVGDAVDEALESIK